ncbi:amino acid transporter [Streptacidiphilus sp. BW17]|uniref:APC family permease n=1 Tax=Streptacidiphilus sp. BW17 TaxID=3156274 RepID=UPI0035152B0D
MSRTSAPSTGSTGSTNDGNGSGSADPDGRGRTLRREVGLIGLLWASVGSIIGSGWLFSAKNAVTAAGPAALVAWGIGAVAMIILALVHAELGGMFPISGGTARYPHLAFGGAAGASFGWFSWLSVATTAPIEVMAMIGYADHYSWARGFENGQGLLTGSGLVIAVLLMAVFCGINLMGIKTLARANNAATWWKIGVPMLVVLLLAIAGFHPANFTAGGGFAPFGAKGVLLAVPGSGIIFALMGFEQAIQIGGESKQPGRDIPRAVVGSMVLGVLLYILLQIVYIGALPSGAIHHWADLAYAGISGPFAGLVSVVGMGWLAAVLYLDAVISPAGTGLIYTTAASRISYGLSRNGYVPSAFEKLDRRGVPWVGIVAAFVVGCVAFLPFPSWNSLVNLVTSASVLMYAGAPLAFGVFRSRLPDVARPFRLKAGGVLAPAAFVVANLIIFWSGWDTVWKLGVAVGIGYLLLAIARVLHTNPVEVRLDFRAAQWLPAYLVGMGLITWVSDFGPWAHPWLPFGWDMAVVAVFSIAIYAWAVAVALPTDRIEELTRETQDLADTPVADPQATP